MAAPYTTLGWGTFVLLIISWVLLLIPSITTESSNDLSLANVFVNTGDEVHVARFGVLGFNADSMLRDSAYSSLQSGAGYRGSISLLQRQSLDLGPDQPDTRIMGQTVLQERDTEALVLFPVALGLLAVSLITLPVGLVKRNVGCQGAAALFTAVAVGLAWAAWGFAFALPSKMDDRLERYKASDRGLWLVWTERGNALWPALVGVILLTLSFPPIIGAMLLRPKDTADPQEAEMKAAKDPNAHRESQTTLA